MQPMRPVLLVGTLLVSLVLVACQPPSTAVPQATVPAVTPTSVLDHIAPITRTPSPVPAGWQSPTPVIPTATFTQAVPTTRPTQPPPTATPQPSATPVPTAVTRLLTVTIASANVRGGPGTGFPVLGAVKRGQQLTVTGRTPKADWWQVDFQGQPGWLAASVVTTPATPDEVAVIASPAATAAAATSVAATPAVTTTLSSTPAPLAQAATPSPAPAAPAALAGHIAFTRGRGSSSDIALLDVASGSISTVVADGRMPDVRSLDGRIVFKGAGNGKNDIFSVMPDGSGLAHLTKNGEDRYPNWAPTRDGIAYSSTSSGSERLYVQWHDTGSQPDEGLWISTKGGMVHLYGAAPVWLDNNRLAYAGCDVWGGGGSCGIWSLNAANRFQWDPYQIVPDTGVRPTDAAGETLLYVSANSGNWEVYGVRFTPPARKIDPKGVPVDLTNNPAQDTGASFSPDGTHIAFMSDRGGSWGIWVMDAAGAHPRLLAAVPEGFGQQWQDERVSWGK